MNGKVNRIGSGNCALKGIVEEAKAKRCDYCRGFCNIYK